MSRCVNVLPVGSYSNVRTLATPVCVTARCPLFTHCTSSGESGTVVVRRSVSVASGFTWKMRSSSTVLEIVPFATARNRPSGDSESVCGPSPDGNTFTRVSDPLGLTVKLVTESPTLFVTNTAGAIDCASATEDEETKTAAASAAKQRRRCIPNIPHAPDNKDERVHAGRVSNPPARMQLDPPADHTESLVIWATEPCSSTTRFAPSR